MTWRNGEDHFQVTWTKTGENAWNASFGNPALSSDTTKTTGTTTGSIAVVFNSDGSLASATPATISITGWTDGAADSTITMNLGTAGKTDGLSQYSSGATTPAVDVTSISSDGLPYGKLSSVAVGDDGTVNATYSNGQTIAIYKIPVATFTAPDGLKAQSNGLYAATAVFRKRGGAGFRYQRCGYHLRQRVLWKPAPRTPIRSSAR